MTEKHNVIDDIRELRSICDAIDIKTFSLTDEQSRTVITNVISMIRDFTDKLERKEKLNLMLQHLIDDIEVNSDDKTNYDQIHR